LKLDLATFNAALFYYLEASERMENRNASDHMNSCCLYSSNSRWERLLLHNRIAFLRAVPLQKLRIGNETPNG
jgi:hypothetical protein